MLQMNGRNLRQSYLELLNLIFFLNQSVFVRVERLSQVFFLEPQFIFPFFGPALNCIEHDLKFNHAPVFGLVVSLELVMLLGQGLELDQKGIVVIG
jgi:hypothetical protein